MDNDLLFCNLTSNSMQDFIRSSERSICYAGPGIQIEIAKAITDKAKIIGIEMITVCIDFDERVMRMGYGHIKAVETLLDADIRVNNAKGLRNALIIVDDKGFSFTPTALLLEGESNSSVSLNAMRLSHDQVSEALARLSPSAKAIAMAQCQTQEGKSRIASLPVDVDSTPVSDDEFHQVNAALEIVPTIQFDIARQVHVFNAYFQYVELKLSGAAIQRRKIDLPPAIQMLGDDSSIQKRLHTTFNLIASNSALSSKALDQMLRKIRKDLTRPLGKNHGSIVLKSAKIHLEEELKTFREKLEAHQKNVEGNLQKMIDESREGIAKFYLPLIMKRIDDKDYPQGLRGVALSNPPSESDAISWLISLVSG